MTTNRRDVIKGGVALAVRSALYSGGIGVTASLTSCGGGGGGGSSAPQVDAPSGLSYTTPVQCTVGTAITTLTPTVTGSVTSYSVSPALPAGLSLNTTTGVISGTPSAAAAQATYTVTATNAGGSTTFALSLSVNAAFAISSVSNAAPMALTPVSLVTTGLDTTKPFTVTLVNSGGSQVTVSPIRAQTDGTVVIPIPLVIDAGSGQTTGLTANLQISQNGATSNAVQIVISDLPSLSDLGLSPGQLSQAFNTYQTLSLGANINTQQAIGMLPGATGVPGNLLSNLQTQLLNIINTRNVIDNIVANPAYSLPVGAANDGTAITFNQASISTLDRILAQYLAALTNQSAVSLAVHGVTKAKSSARHFSVRPDIGSTSRSVLIKNEAVLPALGSASNSVPMKSESVIRQSALGLALPAGIGMFVTGLTTLGGAANVVSTGQTLVSQNSTTTDKILSVASAAASVIAVGATIVAATAAAPEIVAGAVVVAAWSFLLVSRSVRRWSGMMYTTSARV